MGYMDRSPYGAAVDIEGNAWFVNAYCGGTLVRVDYDDLSYDLINPPAQVCPYGIAVDSQGYVWIGGYQTYTGRYDPVNDAWDLVQAQGLGIQEDAEGRLWLGAYGQNGVYAIDGDTLQVLSYTPVPTTGQSKGVAIDFFGYVWVVSDAGNVAVRLDPDTLEIQTYAGLDSPYSYSDMTGWGLNNAAVVPQG
jgi:streptogramin lyase